MIATAAYSKTIGPIIFLVVVAFSTTTLSAFAEGVAEPPETMMTPPFGSVPEPTPPAVGDGPVPSPITPGDGGTPAAPPTGRADPGPGHFLHTRPARDTRTPTLYGAHPYFHRTESALPSSFVRNRLGPATNYGIPAEVRNDPKVYPSVPATRAGSPITKPPTGDERPSVKIMRDGTQYGGTITRIEPNHLWERQMDRMPMPTVRKFARFLVLAGVVFATVLMAFSAMSMCLGHPYAGGRAVSTAAGLLILLAGFTIYKIIMINAFRFSTESDSDIRKPPRSKPTIVDGPSPRRPRVE